MPLPAVIVFGPTGNVGLIVARTLHEQGVRVILAMRDVQKPLHGLYTTPAREEAFKKVQADLMQPVSVRHAVTSSGAKRAFIYNILGAADHMRATIEALKSSGIEFVVFLSTFTITSDIRSFPPSDPVPYAHAQVEVNLDDIFGPGNFIAVRPGWYATNLIRPKSALKPGSARIYGGDLKVDWITPPDIGAVCANLLISGPRQASRLDQHFVTVNGPRLYSLREAVKLIEGVVGVDYTITDVDEEEAVQLYVQDGLPEFAAKFLVKRIGALVRGDMDLYSEKAHAEAVENVRKYTERAPTQLPDWLEANKHRFT